MSEQPLKVIAGAPDKPLIIGDIEIPCYVLEDESRVLTQSGVFSALGLARRGLVPIEGGAQMPRFAASKSIRPFIPKDLEHGLTNPILMTGPGIQAYAFKATILADICETILKVRDAGSLNSQQGRLADRCELLMRGFARVGIEALVDEVTGYQRIREERALATILENFIAEELQPWTKTFPYEFYQEIFRLKKWDGPYGRKRSPLIGKYTNDIVYSRLAPGVLDELKKRNPKLPSGRRKSAHHQWFTPEHGHPKLREHLVGVMAIMRASPNWGRFMGNLARSYKKHADQLDFEKLDD